MLEPSSVSENQHQRLDGSAVFPETGLGKRYGCIVESGIKSKARLIRGEPVPRGIFALEMPELP
jgi:hypothetical protein